MEHGGSAWRGWFPLDGELTSGVPDHKEGIYFGTELGPDDPAVRAGVPLHGANLFPAPRPGYGRPCSGGSTRWRGSAPSCCGYRRRPRAASDWFEEHVTADPTILFRIFRYPPEQPDGWGVAEHTDYGLLTILATDANDGPAGARAARVDRRTVRPRGVRRQPRRHARADDRGAVPLHAAPRPQHRGGDRLSFPCFIDPSWDAGVPGAAARWTAPADEPDGAGTAPSVRGWDGTYGDYLTAKVARVFPELFARLSGPRRPRIG